MAGYIDDGYTRDDGYIAAAQAGKAGERLWDALEFSYRVATRQEVIRHDAKVRIALLDENTDPECAVQAEKLACDFVADKVKSWTLKDRNGRAVVVTSDACSRLNPGLFGSLYRIIRGVHMSDPKPPAEVIPSSDEEQQKN